jgi:hypothetical protein
MQELSVAEQRYLAVIGDGETVTDVAARFWVSRQTVHNWPTNVRGRSPRRAAAPTTSGPAVDHMLAFAGPVDRAIGEPVFGITRRSRPQFDPRP